TASCGCTAYCRVSTNSQCCPLIPIRYAPNSMDSVPEYDHATWVLCELCVQSVSVYPHCGGYWRDWLTKYRSAPSRGVERGCIALPPLNMQRPEWIRRVNSARRSGPNVWSATYSIGESQNPGAAPLLSPRWFSNVS